jgi:RNA polymerase sigma-70 factor, ECF subfamily
MMLSQGEDNMQDKSDTELVMRAKAGDQEAYATLFLRYKVGVYNCLMKIVSNNSEVAQDLFQDTYLKAWENIQGLREPAKFGGWLLTLARNLAFDHRRKNPPERASPLEKSKGTSDDPSNTVIDAVSIVDVLKNIEPATYREILILDAQGYSLAQIASELGYKESTVRIYMSKARRKARQLYHHLIDDTGDN